MWKKLMKDVDIEELTSCLDHVYLGCTQGECKPNENIVGQYNKMFDHQIKKEELENKGELPEVCSHIVLKCLYLARIGRPDILWSVNKLALSVTKWTQACDRRLARLTSYIHFTSDYRQYCHVGNAAQHCRLGLFQDSDFAGDLEDSKSTLGGVLCILEVEQFYRSVGCARSKRQCRTALLCQRSYRWMLVCIWTVHLSLIYGIWSLKC